MGSRAGAKNPSLGAEAGQPGGMRTPDPMRLEPAQGHRQRGGAPRQAIRSPKHQDGGALLRGDLQPKVERWGNGFPAHEPWLAEIQHDEREAGAAREEIRRAERRAQPSPALHPEEPGEIDARRNGRSGIECIRAIHEGGLTAGGRGSGDQGEEQAAAS